MCFACTHVYYVWAVIVKDRKGNGTQLELELQIVVRHDVSAGYWTWASAYDQWAIYPAPSGFLKFLSLVESKKIPW